MARTDYSGTPSKADTTGTNKTTHYGEGAPGQGPIIHNNFRSPLMVVLNKIMDLQKVYIFKKHCTLNS